MEANRDVGCVSDPFMLPHMQVDKGAVSFVLSGANIMCPGLTSAGANMTKVDRDTIVVSFTGVTFTFSTRHHRLLLPFLPHVYLSFIRFLPVFFWLLSTAVCFSSPPRSLQSAFSTLSHSPVCLKLTRKGPLLFSQASSKGPFLTIIPPP